MCKTEQEEEGHQPLQKRVQILQFDLLSIERLVGCSEGLTRLSFRPGLGVPSSMGPDGADLLRLKGRDLDDPNSRLLWAQSAKSSWGWAPCLAVTIAVRIGTSFIGGLQALTTPLTIF